MAALAVSVHDAKHPAYVVNTTLVSVFKPEDLLLSADAWPPAKG
jgi:hypothetical protein